MHKKIITAIGITILFLGIGIQPAFAINPNEPNDSKLEEITIEFYETDKTYEHTVMLTREQIKELKNLIDDFEIKIDNADNKIETEAIYKDTVVSLNDIGILPEGMTVEKAKRLVTGKEHNLAVVKIFKGLYKKNYEKIGDNENIICLVGGWGINDMFFTRGIMTVLTPIWNSLYKTIYDLGKIGPLFELFVYEILLNFFDIPLSIRALRPFGVGYELFFGRKAVSPDTTRYTPCPVEINSSGLNGKITFNGDMYGQIPQLPIISDINTHDGTISYGYPGIIGFTGVHLIFPSMWGVNIFFLGSALWVKLGEEHP